MHDVQLHVAKGPGIVGSLRFRRLQDLRFPLYSWELFAVSWGVCCTIWIAVALMLLLFRSLARL